MIDFQYLIKQLKDKFPSIKWKLVEDPFGNPSILGSRNNAVFSCSYGPEHKLVYSRYDFKKSKSEHADHWGIFY